jgi:hypothetical protein
MVPRFNGKSQLKLIFTSQLVLSTRDTHKLNIAFYTSVFILVYPEHVKILRNINNMQQPVCYYGDPRERQDTTTAD